MTNETQRLSREEQDELISRIIVCRQLVNIPAKDRTTTDRQTIKNTLEVLENKYIPLIHSINGFVWGRLSNVVLGDDYTFVLDYEKYLHEKKFVPPKLNGNPTERELKTAAIDIYSDRVTILGILSDLTAICEEIDLLLERSESIAKGIMFPDQNQWSAETTYYFTFPETSWEKMAKVKALKQAYKLKADQYEAAYEIVSRLITIELGMPTDAPKRYRNEEVEEPEESEPEVKPARGIRKKFSESVR